MCIHNLYKIFNFCQRNLLKVNLKKELKKIIRINIAFTIYNHFNPINVFIATTSIIRSLLFPKQEMWRLKPWLWLVSSKRNKSCVWFFLAISNIFRNTKKSWNLISIDNEKYFCRSCQCWFCSYQWHGLKILKVFKHKSYFCVMIHSRKRMIHSKKNITVAAIYKSIQFLRM